MEHGKNRRYYEVGESVYVKPENSLGTIKALEIKPKENIYKATVETVKKSGDATIVRTEKYDLWDLDKNRNELYKNKRKEQLTVLVKYFDSEVEKIELIEIGDWVDLRSRIDVDIKQFSSFKIPLNIAMKLPDGYEAHVLPRSSTFDKWGIMLANSEGIIDNSYSGNDDEWSFNAVAIKCDAHIKKGDRICQFKIERKMDKDKFKFKTVNVLFGKNRGGYGTTGSN